VVAACYKERSDRGRAAMAMTGLKDAPAGLESDVTIDSVEAIRLKLRYKKAMPSSFSGNVPGERAPR
jgi:hypothetical protein